MKNNEVKKEIVLYSNILESKGLVNSLEGNISIYDREKDLLYVTPTMTRKSFLTEEMVAVMKEHEQIEGTIKRSSEYLLHKLALDARSDCNAAVHSHSPFLTAYAYCNKSIDIKCSTTFAILHDGIPCIPYGEPGTIEITQGLPEAIKNHNLVLLANHGCICVAPTLEMACSIIEATEEVMKIYFMAKFMGVSDIPDDKISHLQLMKRGGSK
jgi:L-fuculose-phosphate aldolase